jgi:hypothetical protein
MRRAILAPLMTVLALGAGNTWAGDSPYLKGKQAWVADDFAQARVQWALSISEGGPDYAYNNLGVIFYHGYGVGVDRARGVAYWLKGAALAVSEAQWNLGNAYLKGHGGLQRSRTHAYAWYECARVTALRLAESNSVEKRIAEKSADALGKLARTISKADRAAGELLAKELIAKYASPLPVLRDQ